MIESFIKFHFLQNAFIASILASIACGIIGTIITEKSLVMLSSGISHTVFGGVGFGYFLGIEPLIGAMLFALSSSFGIAKIHRKSYAQVDVLMGMFWPLGMALGILFIAFSPGYPPDLSSYLFGDILTVGKFDIFLMLIFDILMFITILSLFNHIKAYMFDEEFLQVMKFKIQLFDYLIFAMVAATIVILIRVVGIILILALLTAPTATAKLFTHNLKKIMVFSTLLGILFCLSGLFLSYQLNVPSGATIVITSCIFYFACVFLKPKILNKMR